MGFTTEQLVQAAVILVTNVATISIAWGNLRSGQRQNDERLDEIRKALGLVDGTEGQFIRRSEVDLLRAQAAERHLALVERVSDLEFGHRASADRRRR